MKLFERHNPGEIQAAEQLASVEAHVGHVQSVESTAMVIAARKAVDMLRIPRLLAEERKVETEDVVGISISPVMLVFEILLEVPAEHLVERSN